MDEKSSKNVEPVFTTNSKGSASKFSPSGQTPNGVAITYGNDGSYDGCIVLGPRDKLDVFTLGK